MNFCDKCKRIVPDEEIKYWEPNSFHQGYYSHCYEDLVNIAEPSSGMNACLQMQTIYCGNIREPSQEEYFLYIILDIKEELNGS